MLRVLAAFQVTTRQWRAHPHVKHAQLTPTERHLAGRFRALPVLSARQTQTQKTCWDKILSPLAYAMKVTTWTILIRQSLRVNVSRAQQARLAQAVLLLSLDKHCKLKLHLVYLLRSSAATKIQKPTFSLLLQRH